MRLGRFFAQALCAVLGTLSVVSLGLVYWVTHAWMHAPVASAALLALAISATLGMLAYVFYRIGRMPC
jgi:hypothetical protein